MLVASIGKLPASVAVWQISSAICPPKGFFILSTGAMAQVSDSEPATNRGSVPNHTMELN